MIRLNQLTAKFFLILSSLIAISATSFAQTETEPNNDFETANVIATNKEVTGSLCPGGDVDYFRTVLPADGKYRVYMEATNTGGGNNGYLYVSGYDQRKNDGNIFNNTVANYLAAGATAIDSVDVYCRSAADTFYFRVSQANQCFNYKITYKLIGAPTANDVEPNNTFAQATTFNIGDTAKGHIGYVAGGGVTDQFDFYKTVLPADGKYRVYMEATNTGGGNNGYLYVSGYDQRQADGNIFNNTVANYLAAGATAIDSVDLYCRSAADTFYFRVSQSNQCFNYKITYKLIGAPTDNDIEPNNTFAQATTFNIGDTAKGHIGYVAGGGVTDQLDFYKTVLPADGKYRVYMEATNTGGGNNGYLYVSGYDQRQADGNIFNNTVANYLAAGATAIDSVDLYCRSAADTFYFRVSQSNQCFNYKITYKLIGAPTDNDIEPNNTFAQATTFNIGDTAKGHIGYVAGGGVTDQLDFYKTVLPADGKYRVYLEATNTGGGNNGYLYVSGYDQRKTDGNIFNNTVANYLAAGTTAIDSVDLYNRSAADTFYFRVSQANQCFNYKITYKLIGAPADNDAEPNNTFAEATTFNIGETAKGHIGYVAGGVVTDQFDFYKTVLSSDGKYRIYVEATNTGNGNNGYLYLSGYDQRQADGNIFNNTIANYLAAGSTAIDSVDVFCRSAGDTLYFRLSQGNQGFSYKVSYKLINPNNYSTVDIEPNNSLTAASYFAQHDSVKANIGHYLGGKRDDYDYYKTKIPYKGTLRIYTEATNTSNSNNGYFYLQAYNKDGGLIFNNIIANYAASGTTSAQTINLYCQTADTLYFNVISYNSCFSYKLSYEVVLGSDTTVYACSGCTTNISKLYNTTPFSTIKYQDIGSPGTAVNPESVRAGTYMLSVINGNDECTRDTAIITVSTGQVIAFDSIPDKVLGDPPFVVKATSSEGLQVTYKVLSGPATISKDTVTVNGVGTVTIRAEQAGNNAVNYAFADRTFKVNKASATITLSDKVKVYDGKATTPTAVTDPPSLPVTYTFNGSSDAPANAGSYQVIATINSPEYSGSVTDTFVIKKANQTVSINPIPDKEYGNPPFTVSASATSGLPVTFNLTSSPANIASVDNNTITINGLGTVVVSAIQAGNNNYNASTAASDTFVISKGNPVITFTDIPDHIVGDTVKLNARSSSGLPLVYSLTTDPAAGVARVSHDTVFLNNVIGTVTVTASQNANENYNAATAQKSFKALGKPQTINFATLPGKTLGDAPFAIRATASSGLPVTFTVISGPAIISKDTVTLTGDGTVVIEARQPGNSSYASAAPVQQSFTVIRKYSDLTVTNVTSDNVSISPADAVTIGWNVSNIGDITSDQNWTERIYMQSAGGSNRTLIKQVNYTFDGKLAKDQSTSRTERVVIPAQVNIGDDGVFVVEVVPGSTVAEAPGPHPNNIGVQQKSFVVSKLLTVEVNTNQITEGGDAVTAKVSRTGSLTNALTVNLSFRNPQRFSFPSNVTIPAGQAATTFTISAINNNLVEGTIPDTLSLSAPNFTGAAVNLSILDDDKPTLTISQLPAEMTEGQSVTFKISTDINLKQPLQVFLTSNNQKRFPVPSSVTIPAGARAVDVTVKLEQNTIPELDVPVNIIAGAANHNSASASILVKDDDIPGLELVLQTNIISEAAGYYATKGTLRRKAGSNPIAFTTTLSASLPNTLILPASVSLAAGENEKTFDIGAIDNTLADGDRRVFITASIFVNSCGCSAPTTSAGSVSAAITVTDNDGPALQITANQITFQGGQSPAGFIRVTRNTPTNDAVTVTLSSSNKRQAAVPATVVIPVGQTFVDVPVTTYIDTATPGNQQVYFQSSSAGFSAGSIYVIVTDVNKPDFQIPVVKLANSAVQAMSVFNYQVTVKNSGFATTPAGVKVRGYLSKDDLIDNSDSLISEDITSDAIPAGESLQILNAAKVPNMPGQYKLLYIVNPELTLSELVTTNNTSAPVNITIKPDYTATAIVDATYFLKGVSVPITGAATKSDGATASNEKVEVYIITNGLRRTVTATTDATGKYTTQFVPLQGEAGHYSVGASYPGLGSTFEQDNFDIVGVRVNDGNVPQFKVVIKDSLQGTLSIQNLSNKSLNNFTLASLSLPNGALIKFAKVPVLQGNATIQLGYKISGSALSPGSNFEVAKLNAVADEGTIQPVNLYYYCQAPNAYVEATVTSINVSASLSKGERLVEFKLVNKGLGETGEVTIGLPQIAWLTSVTPKTISSMASGDTSTVLLKFLALPEVPFDYPINGNVSINTKNGNSVNIPFTFKKVSESVGTVSITATDQFTYFSTTGPKVAGAHVVIKNYYTGQVYADAYTDSSGVMNAAGIPEGTHRITVEKDQHQPYSNTITINPGQTVESTVFLSYQAITFNWSVVPTAIQDQYDITLESKFETNIPMPVVTIDMPKTMPQLSGNETYAFNVTLTNHGLITANNVTLGLPTNDEEYEFVTNYVPGDLVAQQSIQVPVILRRRTRAGAGGRTSVESISNFLGMQKSQYRSAASQGGSCTGFTSVIYFYSCNLKTGLFEKGGAIFSYSGRRCDPTGAYTGVPVDVGYTTGGGGYNDVPCATCGPGIFTGQPLANTPTPPAKQEKKSCKKCIEAVADILGCAGPTQAKDVAKCVGKNVLKGAEWSDYADCVPLPPPLNCLRSLNGAADACQGVGISGRSSLRGTGANSLTASPLGAVFDRIAGNLKLVEQSMNLREVWLKEYYGEIINSNAFSQFRSYLAPSIISLDSIRQSKQDSVLAAMSGYDIKPDVMKAFFARWNTSVYARRQGVLEPNRTYPGIVNWTKSKSYSDSIVYLYNDAVAKGFESVEDMWGKEYKALNVFIEGEQNAVCASVTVQLSQRLTMTREAFEGTLDIFNGHPTDKMDSLSVNIQITDANGVPSNGLFEIQTKSLNNLSNVTGTGAIASQQKGTVKFLFIPTREAAPTTSKLYNFGGSVRYFDPYAKTMVTVPLSAPQLTVNPSPNLMLHYFMERNILGDDPLTTAAIEPSVPAELAVMVENQGYGAAVNMAISSAQPKIEENEKGLAINFKLIGSNFQGQPKNLGVTDINFGTIPALQTRIGQWYFTSSLLGKFVSYDAKVVHSNSFGNPELSLVKGVKLHELTHSIREYGAKDDGINDFLVNDVFDIHDIPDIIYFSQGNRTEKVVEAAAGSFSSPVMPPTFTNTLTVTASNAGWNYVKLNDPGNRLYDIASVRRNDGQVIPLSNAWLTFVTLPVNQAPKYENKFHFVDSFPTTQPVSYTVVWKPRSTDVPKVDSIIGIPKEITSTQVKNLKVVFNKSINASTFTSEDLTLTLQGGQNIMNSSVVITPIDSVSFNVDLSKITTGNGFYNLTVQAAEVSDVYGIKGSVGKQATWTQFLDVPAVQAFQGIPENRIASSYDKIQVLFNLPIDPTTVTGARFKVLKDSVEQPGTLTIDSVRADKKLFYLSGLQNILTQNGEYLVVVDLPNIKSADKVAGVEAQSVRLTLDNLGPLVTLEKSGTGGLDNQHIPFVNIKFNEDVFGFNTSAVKLTRNGQVVTLKIDQLSGTDGKTWKADLGTLTYPEGNYTFSIDLSKVRDVIGNYGTGAREISWSVNRSVIVEVTKLAVTPDLGYSNSDGVTSTPALNVKFALSGRASKVTVSQVDLSGEQVLTTVTNVAAGDAAIPVTLSVGGNTGIKVTATGENGGTGSATMGLYIDQQPLSAHWVFGKNQTLSQQIDTIKLALSARLLRDEGFLGAVQLKRNNAVVSGSLNYSKLNDSLYEVRGLRSLSNVSGSYELTFNSKPFSKYLSGLAGAELISVSWIVQPPNQAPIAKAGSDMIVAKPAIVTLDGSGSFDPDSDPITYRWIAPAGVVLSDSTSAKPTFNVTVADNGNNYSFLLVVSDGKAFATSVVNVNVAITNQEYYRSMITGAWSDPATWQSSADSITWSTAVVSPNNYSRTITILAGHTVTVKQNVTTDETFVQPGGTLTVDAGSRLTVINKGLTLMSNADSSGAIGVSAGNITGSVTVERFIPARRAWRLLSVPLANSQTIRDAWQEGGATIPGYGTHITGGNTTNGFDSTSTQATSIVYFNSQTGEFKPISSTLNPLGNYPGYFLFVRGDRTINLALGRSAKPTNTILRASGTLKIGTQPVVPVPANGFTLIGNPYAATIDFTKLSKTYIPDRFFVWDPKRSASGAFVLFDSDNGYMPLGRGGSYKTANTLIPSGQAFLVEGTATEGSVGIAETSKSNGQRNSFRATDAQDEKLLISLHSENADTTATLVDAALAKYNDSYSTAVTFEDAGKPENIEENLAIIRNNRSLTVEKRPLIKATDTLYLRMYNMKEKGYQFEFVPTNFASNALTAHLVDSYSGTRKPISLTAPSRVSFSITSDAASANAYRFKIVFSAAREVPISKINVDANIKDNGVRVDWKVVAETNTNHYEVERSADGFSYEKLTNVIATGNDGLDRNYTWLDNTPMNGDNFYRIKSVDNNAVVKYSNAVNVKLGNGKSSIVVYPNPVSNKVVYVQLNNQPQGNFTVQLYNNLGQQLMNTTINHTGGSSTQKIPLSSLVSKGMYQLVIGNGETKLTQQIVIE